MRPPRPIQTTLTRFIGNERPPIPSRPRLRRVRKPEAWQRAIPGGKWVSVREGRRGPPTKYWEYPEPVTLTTHKKYGGYQWLAPEYAGPCSLSQLLIRVKAEAHRSKRRGPPERWPKVRLLMLVHHVALFVVGNWPRLREYQNCRASGANDASLRVAAFRAFARWELFVRPARSVEQTSLTLRRRYYQALRNPRIVQKVEELVPDMKGRL